MNKPHQIDFLTTLKTKYNQQTKKINNLKIDFPPPIGTREANIYIFTVNHQIDFVFVGNFQISL